MGCSVRGFQRIHLGSGLRRPSTLGLLLTAVLLLTLSVVAGSLAGAQDPDEPGAAPGQVASAIDPGDATTVEAGVRTPVVPPRPDVVLLVDGTESMAPTIENVQENLDAITSGVREQQPDSRFAVAAFGDAQVDGARTFEVFQKLTYDLDAVRDGVNDLTADRGGYSLGPAEDWLNALWQIGNGAHGATKFRENASPVVVLVGDASSHDPSLGHSLQDTISVLDAAGVRLVGVDVNTDLGDGLNGDGTSDWSTEPPHEPGQARAIVEATGGSLFEGIAAGEVSDTITEGLTNLPTTVSYETLACDPALSVTLDPSSQTVTSGEIATFSETIEVADYAAQGATLNCTVQFLLDGRAPNGDASSEELADDYAELRAALGGQAAGSPADASSGASSGGGHEGGSMTGSGGGVAIAGVVGGAVGGEDEGAVAGVAAGAALGVTGGPDGCEAALLGVAAGLVGGYDGEENAGLVAGGVGGLISGNTGECEGDPSGGPDGGPEGDPEGGPGGDPDGGPDGGPEGDPDGDPEGGPEGDPDGDDPGEPGPDPDYRQTISIAVNDVTEPVVTVDDRTIEAPGGENGAPVDFTATAEDGVDGELPVSCDPESGSRFPVGTTEVTCTATDSAGNTGSDTATFTVLPPSGSPPEADVTVTGSVAPGPSYTGVDTEARFTLTNAGPSPAEDVVLTTAWPRTTDPDDRTLAVPSDCTASDPCTIPAGGRLVVTQSAVYDQELTGEVQAGVTGTPADPDLGDNDTTAPLRVLQPEVTLSPEAAAPGEVAVARGDDFPPGTVVELIWDRGLTAARSPLVVESDGTFEAQMLVLRKDQTGQRALRTEVTGTPIDIPDEEFLVVQRNLQPPDFAGRG
jgi:von Willebrand factor type A domain-containing protein/HYR domain-containing protein